MMTPKTRRNIILTACFILLLIFLWLLSFLIPKQKTVENKTVTPTTEVPPTTTPYTTEQLQQEKQTRIQASGVTTVAKIFTERYGSYSNEANFQNIRDVIPMMSKTFADATIKDLATKQQPTGFYGITTRVITVKIMAQDTKAGTATLKLSTQRVEENGSSQKNNTKYQEIELRMVQESGVWLVDSAKWL